MGLFLASIVATMSRGGFVGLATLGAFVFVVSPPRRKLLVVLFLIVAILGLVVFAPPRYWHEVQSIETSTDRTDTGYQRIYMWGMAWRMFVDHPVIGVGTNNFGIQAPDYEDSEYAEQSGRHMWGRVAHSMYLTVLAEQGTVGTILFLLTVVWTFRVGGRLRARGVREANNPEVVRTGLLATGLLAGVIGVLVSGAFLSVLYYPVFWVLVALIAALERVGTKLSAALPNSEVSDLRRRRSPSRGATRLQTQTIGSTR
jgi:O-antigen ligase